MAIRYDAAVREVLERLRSDPAVADVTFTHDFPGEAPHRRFEVAGPGAPDWSRSGAIAPDLFRTIDVPGLAGREAYSGRHHARRQRRAGGPGIRGKAADHGGAGLGSNYAVRFLDGDRIVIIWNNMPRVPRRIEIFEYLAGSH